MRYYVGVTDNDWFGLLADLKPDEVNFWRPSGQMFRSIEIGAPFLFKLHSPHNYIVGGGFFVRSHTLPLTIAWDFFHKNNGAPDFQTLKSMIMAHRRDSAVDPEIGCTVLNAPFFFPRELWIPIPADWSMNIVTGKTYDTVESNGRDLWTKVEHALSQLAFEQPEHQGILILPSENRYGEEYLTRARLGQGAFRFLVTDAYHRSCSITGERTLPVLQASHIKPFAQDGPNRTENGLLLRSDLHILFDRGYITVTPEYRVEVSNRIKEEFNNGRVYYPLHGKKIENLPDKIIHRPSKEFLMWHNSNKFI